MALKRTRIPQIFCIVATAWVISSLTCHASFAEDTSAASTSRQSKEEVLRSIPLQQLNQATREKLSPILDKPNLYRRMPVETIRCDHPLHTFIVRKPEVLVGIWKLMGITQVDARRTGEYQLQASDGAGTDSELELIYGTPDLHIYYGEGVYEGPMIHNRLTGKCVIILQSNLHHDRLGTPMVTDRMHVFMQIDNPGARLIIKTLQPLVGKAADHNFVETARFLTRISDAAQSNPDGVQNMASRLPDCDANVRSEFITVIQNASRRVAVQHQANQANPGFRTQTK